MKTYNEELKAFGKHLRKLRKEKKLSQQALADDCEMKREAVARYENGTRHPSLATLFALAEALDIEVEDLFKFHKAMKESRTK